MALRPTNLKVLCSLSGGVDSSMSLLSLVRPSPSLRKLLLKAALSNAGNTSRDPAPLLSHLSLLSTPNTAAPPITLSIRCVHMTNWTDATSTLSCGDDLFRRSENVAAHIRDSFSTDDYTLRHHPCQSLVKRLYFDEKYYHSVFTPLLDSLSSPTIETPSPDTNCNRFVKFGELKRYSDEHEYDCLVTGHYADLKYSDTDWTAPPSLATALDARKDQTYFLSRVPQSNFKGVVFPLAGTIKTTKDEPRVASPPANPPATIPFFPSPHTTRSLSSLYSLPSSQTPDSMGLCFIPVKSFPAFISEYLPSPADSGCYVCVETGVTLGSFTVDLDSRPAFNPGILTAGQAIQCGGLDAKYFVVKREVLEGSLRVVVCRGTKHGSLYADEFEVGGFNWMCGEVREAVSKGVAWRGWCRVRHGQPLCGCTIVGMDGGRVHGGRIQVTVDKPMRAITRGQVCVVYGEDKGVIGGGEIEGVGESYWEQGREGEVEEGWKSGENDESAKLRDVYNV